MRWKRKRKNVNKGTIHPLGKIPGGYILLARKIWKGKIADHPPHYREIWMYLLDAANHRDINYQGQIIKRGQCIRSYKSVIFDLGWSVGFRKEYYKKHQYDNVMKWLVTEHMVTTTRTVRGTLISICNYDYYQSPENYESCYDCRTRAARVPHACRTINKNEKNVKNVNTKYSFVENSVEFQLGKFLLEKIILRKTDFKKPDLQLWARHIDYIIRLDKRPPDEIREVIVWCQADRFWQNNILSPLKLRQQYDQLFLKMGKKKPGNAPAKELDKKAKFQKLQSEKAVNAYIKNMSPREITAIKEQIYQKYVLGIIPDFETAFPEDEKKQKLTSFYDTYFPIVIREKLGISGCETIARKAMNYD